MSVNIANQVKSVIVAEGYTMKQVLDMLVYVYGWSESLSNFSRKLHTGKIKYSEILQIADVLGYEISWHKSK
ncbi:MAG: LLM class flavin-dependent oxidoreductase [Clostridia bacterium]|nr:LLM class flavin-dependent oxidoreductase [Clostridia bacterium]